MTSVLLIFACCMIVLSILFGLFLQIGFLYKSEKMKYIGYTLLAWLIGNFPYRFAQVTILDFILISALEIKYWAESKYYFNSAQQASAVLGVIYCICVLIGFLIYMWSAVFLKDLRWKWPRFNSEATTNSWNVCVGVTLFVIFALYWVLFVALVVVDYGSITLI